MNAKLTCIRLVAVSGAVLLATSLAPLKGFANSEFASEASLQASSQAQSEASTESASESGAGEIYAPGFGGYFPGYGGPIGYGYPPPPAVVPVSQPVPVPVPVPVQQPDTINVPLSPTAPPVYGVASAPVGRATYARVIPPRHDLLLYRQHVAPRVYVRHHAARRYRHRGGGG